ncbi:hypothetical protein C8A00DRAFT_37004 [Chaetomidium leptoderma]|uniref:Uncharacterized protein n=1 Tax=Chaetomidium leptoderma TaxID=669021 RepID=A0AAN6VFA6_9PEZI|nr:hypothetical protein C8A00DRAFT_37004 [Chaetomidium leptoderma]
MPPMPSDLRGVLRPDSDGSEVYHSPSTHRRRRETDPAAAAAAASASALALAEEEDRRRRGERSRDNSQNPPVSVRVRVHDDRDRNITLRTLTDDEARREQRRRRNDSTPLSPRFVQPVPRGISCENESVAPLSPPDPAFARRAGGKDSAYYSSGTPQAGPSGAVPAAGASMSSLESPGGLLSPGGSHATFTSGPLNDAAAADRRRRRRLERRDGSRQATAVDFS